MDKKFSVNPIKLLLILVGLICFAIGTVGIFLPVLPTVPFYLVTFYCFAKSSDKLHNWFVGTDLYKKHLEPYVASHGMPYSMKFLITAGVTLAMGISYFIVGKWPVVRIVLSVIWACYPLYLFFLVKPVDKEGNEIPKKPAIDTAVVIFTIIAAGLGLFFPIVELAGL